MDEAHVAMATVNGCDSQPDTQPGSPPKRTLADLLAKDQERPPTPPHASSPSDVPAKQSPAPKTTIGELLVKDKQPLSPPPTSKCPIVPVQHHIPKPEVRRKSPEEDGSELERKLAAQRAKKSQAAGAAAAAAAESNVVFSSPQDPTPSPQKPPRTERAGEEQLKDNGLENCEPARRTEELSQNEQLEKSSTEPSQPTVSEPATEKSEEKEVPQSEEKQRTHEQGSPQPDLVQEPAVQSSAQPDQTNEPLIQSCSPGQPEEAVLYSSAQPDEPKEPEPQSSPSLEQPEKPLLLSSAQPDRVKEHILQEVTPTSPKLEPANELKPPPLPSSEPPALGPLSETDLKNLLAEEVKKCKLTKEEMIVIKDMELRKDTARPFSPTKELLELIQHENGIRSPPPIPPPKPQTPSHSRPQSPVVKNLGRQYLPGSIGYNSGYTSAVERFYVFEKPLEATPLMECEGTGPLLALKTGRL
ncbi:hypothetical protein TELCIR_01362 [Teladorsagia circumcincta]|uniref:Uncharacterized protein n=1 Tax=Teladorsagia circumcincta TaxID=45464 RepID=A0A2G9V261_TELCI|nr:hypothetical protein TELCIR_01362 [Teladorsagia circumcincta]